MLLHRIMECVKVKHLYGDYQLDIYSRNQQFHSLLGGSNTWPQFGYQAMSLETIYYIGQSIAVLAVLATLVTLIFQIRQSNKLARTEMSLMTWLPSIEKYYDVLASDDDSKFFYKVFHTSEHLDEA